MPNNNLTATRGLEEPAGKASMRAEHGSPLSAWAALIPEHGEPSLHRPRLCAGLDRARRLAVVRAPVGFGKSVLVTQWVMRRSTGPHRVVLVNGNDIGRSGVEGFWSEVCASLG